jgi:hypothetical protein
MLVKIIKKHTPKRGIRKASAIWAKEGALAVLMARGKRANERNKDDYNGCFKLHINCGKQFVQ